MICYTLQSCNPTQYPDITNICHNNILTDVGQTIYINNDPSKYYRLLIVGENQCVCQIPMPSYSISAGTCNAPQIFTSYQLQNCSDPQDVIEVGLTGVSVIVGMTVEVLEFPDCYTVIGNVKYIGQPIVTATRVIENCTACGGTVFYEIQSCTTGVVVFVELIGAFALGDVIKTVQLDGCWKVNGTSATKTADINVLSVHTDCTDCLTVAQYFFRVQSCIDGSLNTVELVGGVASVGDIITVSESSHCWTILAEVAAAITVFTLTGTITNCDECEVVANCSEDGERTLAYATMVQLPEPTIPDKGFKECCYTNLVLGDLTDSDPYKNDFTGVYFKKQTSGDNCIFVLHELNTGSTYDLNNSIYGEFKDFGDIAAQTDLTTYIVQWRKVLAVLGEGLYRIEKNITIAGLNFPQMSNTFTLEKFSNEAADKTIRIDAKMAGTLVHLDVDFKGSDFETSMRTRGFFGRRNPKYKQDNLVKRNYDTVQISMSQENEYQMQAGLVPECITAEIYDFILFGNELFLSDYNLINHSYKFRVYEVELDSNKGAKYYTTNRDSRLNLTFTDRVKNKRKINC